MADAQELTRLHRLTDDESDLILDFRMLAPDTKKVIRTIIEYGVEDSAKRYEIEAGNVVSIARCPD